MPSQDEFAQLKETVDEDGKKDDALAALGKRIDYLEDRRKEERFVWILVCIILVDCYIFLTSNNSAGPVALLVLEAVLLVVIAKICGVEEVGILLDKAINAWKKDT